MEIAGLRVVILGGDRRELEVARILDALGARVRAVGLPWPDAVSWTANRLEEAAAWADCLVAPVGGTDDVGNVLYCITDDTQPPPRVTAEVVGRIRPGALFFIGKAAPYLRELCRRQEVRLVEFRERDEFAVLNSVPTAEGAIQMAMEHTDITLHGSELLVLGYGRCGRTLAGMLRGLGAHTWVAAREAALAARAAVDGHRILEWGELKGRIGTMEVVFNTVPAVVLPEEVLAHAEGELVVVDLASAPGGVDFLAARRLGIRAYLAPGLPGIVAPKTAGRIVAKVILQFLAREPGGRRAGD